MPSAHEDTAAPDREEALQTFVSALEQGSADVPVLKKLAQLCVRNPVQEPRSPGLPAFSVPLTPSPVDGFARQLTSSDSEFWTQDKLFEQLFNALVRYLDPKKVCVGCDAVAAVSWIDVMFDADWTVLFLPFFSCIYLSRVPRNWSTA